MSAQTLLPIIAPEFDSLDPHRIAGAVELAGGQVGTVFGAQRETAIAYLAAHMLSISAREGGAAGPIQSMTEGNLSVSFGGAGGAADPYDSTSYGKEYKRLRRQAVFGPRTRAMT